MPSVVSWSRDTVPWLQSTTLRPGPRPKLTSLFFSKYRFFIAVVGYRGISAGNQFHSRGNPSTDNSVPAVLPQDSQAKPRDSRGITAVPITVQLSNQHQPCVQAFWCYWIENRANLPNRYSVLCWRPVTHAQTWVSYSTLYRFGRLSQNRPCA